MAYAFKDCCDSSNYFYLNGIPGSVSVGETYYVLTTNGDEFCATPRPGAGHSPRCFPPGRGHSSVF